MQHRRFKDLSIVSAKKPFNAQLFWEHATYGLILVDSGDQTKLFISVDKGDNWVEIDLSDNTNSFKIQAGWLDGNDLWLVMCENDGADTEFEVCFIELDDSNDCNPVDVQATSAADAMFVYDIFKLGSDFYVYWNDDIGVGQLDWITEVTVAPFVAKDSIGTDVGRTSHMVVVGTKAYWWKTLDGTIDAKTGLYDSTIPAITFPFNVINGYFVKTDTNFRGQSYDGSDVLFTVLEKNADNKNYLIEFSITGDAYTIGSEYNIILQLDRNNSASAPNELEKAFSSDAVKTVYEIKAKRGGIRVLQNMADIIGDVIIAITDNFLMVNGGPMFENTDVTNEISTILYNDGIIGILKRGTFTVHPDFHINWNEGDSIKIYDDNDVLEFHGLITNKNRNTRGIYVYKIDSFTNEIYRNTYEKAYSGDDSDTKQKDIIDNACDFCYRSSSIVGTTTNYDYNYNRAIVYLFWLTRFLERQLPYIEPDGKIWTKAYNGLVATGKSWDINDNNQEVFLVDIPGIEENLQGFFSGNSGITRNIIRYKNNATTIRPVAATRDPIEQLQGIIPLNEFRDPKIEAATEANQLGDNRYNIWSSDIIFLGLRIEGQGYLQPGKTIEIQNIGEITISQDDFLILSFERDPKNDIYIKMILSDNIIFPSEFANLQDTSNIQIHTASVQVLENQSEITTSKSDLTTHAADFDAHSPHKYTSMHIANFDGGFAVAGSRYEILNSDAAANIYAHGICPQTRVDWIIVIVSRSSVGATTANGDMDVGAAGSNEATSGTNKINAALNLAHGDAGIAKYSNTAEFSMNAADHINIRWTKNNDAGAGTLRIEEIFLTY